MTMAETDNDLIVVEDNKEGTVLTITSPKRKAKYTIYKPEDGYSMFRISTDSGSIPDHLSGYYTSRKSALADLEFWLDSVPESKEAKWDRMFGEDKVPPLKTKDKKIGTDV